MALIYQPKFLLFLLYQLTQIHISMISEEALVPQQYIDYKDKDNNWVVALILARNKHEIKIRLEGYSSNLDQSIHLEHLESYIRNNKILPFRTLLRGLTGYRRKPSLRQHWKFSKQDHAIRLLKLNEFIHSPKKFSSAQMIQYIRGEHYFYLDFLMTFPVREKEEILKVYQYFEKHLILCKNYLSLIIQVGIKQWFQPALRSTSEEQTWKKTYQECYYQIFDGMYLFGGMDQKNTIAFKLNENSNQEVFNLGNHHNHLNNKIREINIIEKYAIIINKCYEYSLISNNNKIPHTFLINLAKLFLVFEVRMKKQLQLVQEYYKKLNQVIKINLQIIQNSSKHPQIDRQFEQLFLCLKNLYSQVKDAAIIKKWIEECQLNHCIMMIKSDKLQRKLKGLTKYKEYSLKIVKESNNHKNSFIEYFYCSKLIELILENNNNIQFYKKSLEVIFSFAKCNIVSLKCIIYLWENSVNMHISFIKYFHQHLIDVISYLKKEEFQALIVEIEKYFKSDHPQKYNYTNIEFYLQFIIQIVKYNLRERSDNFQQYIKIFTFQAYHMLKQMKNISLSQILCILIKNYAKIVVVVSANVNLIDFFFQTLKDDQHFELILHILVEMYMHIYQYGRKIYVPKTFFKQLSYQIESKELSPEQTSMIIKLINELISISKSNDPQYEIPKDQFKSLWLIFKKKPEHLKCIFYQWIIFNKKYEQYSEYVMLINCIFTSGFKEFILQQIIQDQQIMDYAYLSKKQMEIIIQLIIFNNISHDKLEKKIYQTSIKNIYRIKQVQLNYQSILWNIFAKCKNEEVIIILNKFIINIYMFCVQKLPNHLRKSRIDDLMTKLSTTIKEYKSNSILVVQHSLSLLKGIVQLAKQQKKKEINEKVHNTHIKIQTNFQNKKVSLEVNYQDTIKNIKYNIAQEFKLKLSQFKLLNSRNQQFNFDTRDLPIYLFADKYFKVMEISEDEETLTKFVFSFFDEKLQLTLIQMMEHEILCGQALNLIDELQLKSQKKVIINKIQKILQKYHSEQQKNSCIQYFHLFQIKILLKEFNDSAFMNEYIKGLSFQQLLKCLTYPINSKIQIMLLSKVLLLLMKLLKNGYILALNYNIQEYCFFLMIKTSEYYIAEHQNPSLKENFLKLFESACSVCEDLMKPNKILNFFANHQEFQQLMQIIYLNIHSEKLRQISTERFAKYLELSDLQNEQGVNLQLKILAIFNSIYFTINQLYKQANNQITKSILEFYNFYAKIIRKINKNTVISILIKNGEGHSSIWDHILQSLQRFKSLRSNIHLNKSNNFLLTGNLYLLKAFIMIDYSQMSLQIISFIIEDCLGFKINYPFEPLCKYFLAKKTAFEILEEVLKKNDDLGTLCSIINIVSPNHKIKLWRTISNWSVSIKSENKQIFRGLLNPGCVCYMNSILQQLYMMDQFKNSILKLKVNQMLQNRPSDGSEDEQDSDELLIIKELKDLMFKLSYSEQNIISPISFARSFKTSDKKPLIKINEQMDIDQFQSLLFEKLEKGLKSMNSTNFIKELFSGVYSRQVISKECDHQSQNQEQFFSMSLQVKNNILESFKSLVKIDILDGQNKYYCQKCNKKVKAEMLQSIKKLPPYLILCLKRFQYNYEAEMKIKINDYCEFYPQINLKEFSKQEINKKVFSKDELKNETMEYEDDYFIYKLKGVVVHLGQADSGHYYSFIQVRKGQWFEFNDEQVIPFDVKKLASEAFGNRQTYNEEKIRNAYLLIYERQQKKSNNMKHDQVEEIQENQIIIQTIKKNNREKYKFQLIFSAKYEQFQQRLCMNYQHIQQLYKEKLNAGSEGDISRQLQILQTKWSEYHISYFLLIKIRKESVDSFIESAKFLQDYIKKSHIVVSILLEIIASPAFIEEFFISNPSKQKIRVLSHLFYLAITQRLQTINNSYQLIEQTTEIKQQKSPFQIKPNSKFILKIFKVLKTILITYKFQFELTNLIIRLLQFLDKFNQRGILHNILYEMQIQRIYFSLIIENLSPVSLENQRKNMLALKNLKKQTPLIYFPEIQINNKIQAQFCTYENWKLLFLVLKLKEKFQRTYNSNVFESNYQKIINKFVNFIEGLPSNKLNSLIYQNNSLKGAFYLYNFCREINKMNFLFDHIQKGLKDLQSSKYRPFMLIILTILDDSAKITSYIDKIISILENALKHNASYFFEVDIINQWIHLFAVQNPLFAQKLVIRKQIIDIILPWISKMVLNIPDVIKKNKSNYDRSLNRYYGVVVSTQTKDYQIKFKLLKQDFQIIKSGKFMAKQKFHLCIKPFSAGDKIEYCDSNSYAWKKGKILQNNYGYLVILRNQKTVDRIQIWQDSERIRHLSKEQQQQDELYEQSQSSDISYSQQSRQKDDQSN